MDNVVFDVNGRLNDVNRLTTALDLALTDEYGHQTSIKGWSFDKKKGMVLYWSVPKNEDFKAFDTPLYPRQLVSEVLAFLKSPKAKKVKLKGFDAFFDDEDVSMEKGWRVYTEKWGKVGDEDYSSIAVLPIWLWYGK